MCSSDLSRRSDGYKKGESRMWDVGGDAYASLTGVGLLEVANLSIDEPEVICYLTISLVHSCCNMYLFSDFKKY